MTAPDQAWTDHAECRNDADPDAWFPNGPAATAQIDSCRRCPVRHDCLETAMVEEGDLAANWRYGIRGGLQAVARRALWEERNPAEAAGQVEAARRIRAARWPEPTEAAS